MRHEINKRRGKKTEAGGRFKADKNKSLPKSKQDVQGDGRKCGGKGYLDIKVAQQQSKKHQRREGKKISENLQKDS